MWSKVINNMVERNHEVIKQASRYGNIIVKRNHFIQYSKIACFLDIARCSQDQPHGVVIKSTTDIIITPFGEGLVLMVAASVLELGRGNIDDAFSCPFGDLVNKSDKVLIRIPETHTPAYP